MGFGLLAPALATLALALSLHAEECDPGSGGQTPPQTDPGQGAQDRGTVGSPEAPSPAEQALIEGLFTDPCGSPWLQDGSPECLPCPDWLTTLGPGLLPPTGCRPSTVQGDPPGRGTGRLADEVTGGAFFAPDGGPDSATAACLAALDELERGTDGGGAGGDPPTGPSGDGGIGPSVESLIYQAMTYSELAGGLEVEARVEELALRRNGDSLSEQEREKAQGSIDKLRGHARDMKQKAQDCARQIESSAKGSK